MSNEKILKVMAEVNGEVCTARGRKLRRGDMSVYDGQGFVIV